MTEQPKIHPHILATGGRADSVTHYVCRFSPDEGTHHLRPMRHSMIEPYGEQRMIQTCVYCRKTEPELREEVGV